MDKQPIIVIDTREQLPWSFTPEVSTFRKKLDTGDYSLYGYDHLVSIERKSLDDLVGVSIYERERFLAELARYREKQLLGFVAVEATISDILQHHYVSSAHPNSVLGSAVSFMLDEEVPVLFLEDRTHAEIYVEKYLTRLWQYLRSFEETHDGNYCPSRHAFYRFVLQHNTDKRTSPKRLVTVEAPDFMLDSGDD